MMNGIGCGGWWWWGSLLTIAIFGLLAWAIIAMVNKNRAQEQLTGSFPAPWKNALDILKERYARGEISKEEFDRMKKDLK